MIIYRYCPSTDTVALDRYKEIACYEFALADKWDDHAGNNEKRVNTTTPPIESLKKSVEAFGLTPNTDGPFKFWAYFQQLKGYFDHIWVEYGDWVYDTTPGAPIRKINKGGMSKFYGPSYTLQRVVCGKEYNPAWIVGPICVTTVRPELTAILNDATLGHWVPEYSSEE